MKIGAALKALGTKNSSRCNKLGVALKAWGTNNSSECCEYGKQQKAAQKFWRNTDLEVVIIITLL